MRKFSIIWLCVFLLSSCGVTSSLYYDVSLSKVESPIEKEVKIKKCTIPKSIQTENGLFFYDEYQYLFSDQFVSMLWQYDVNKGDRFNFVLQNVSKSTIKIYWNEIVYSDENSVVTKVDNKGFNDDAPMSIVPASLNFSGVVHPDTGCSTLFPKYSTQQHVSRIVGRKVKIYFPIEIDNKKLDYIFEFNIDGVGTKYE
ncbi:MAG: hypothetical protein E7130_00850 [Rikenellaceae bacterium]|nr:hypothetical protein [Rikenellaceae bacterium]